MDSKMGGRNYGCTEWRCGAVLKVSTNNNRNVLLKSIESTLFLSNIISYKHEVLNNSIKTISLKSDTGATRNYIRGQDTIILKNSVPTTTGPRVRLADNSVIQPTLSVLLPLPILPSSSMQAHTYPNFKSVSILSIGKLCDSDWSTVFKKKWRRDFQLIQDSCTQWNKEHIRCLMGYTNQAFTTLNTSHWNHNYKQNPLLRLDKTKSELASYLHADAGCPKNSTFIHALNNGKFYMA